MKIDNKDSFLDRVSKIVPNSEKSAVLGLLPPPKISSDAVKGLDQKYYQRNYKLARQQILGEKVLTNVEKKELQRIKTNILKIPLLHVTASKPSESVMVQIHAYGLLSLDRVSQRLKDRGASTRTLDGDFKNGRHVFNYFYLGRAWLRDIYAEILVMNCSKMLRSDCLVQGAWEGDKTILEKEEAGELPRFSHLNSTTIQGKDFVELLALEYLVKGKSEFIRKAEVMFPDRLAPENFDFCLTPIRADKALDMFNHQVRLSNLRNKHNKKFTQIDTPYELIMLLQDSIFDPSSDELDHAQWFEVAANKLSRTTK